jgi:hypothetical protein
MRVTNAPRRSLLPGRFFQLGFNSSQKCEARLDGPVVDRATLDARGYSSIVMTAFVHANGSIAHSLERSSLYLQLRRDI